jgi:hypothetical protein
MLTLSHDRKAQHLQRFDDPVARRVDREFHTTATLPVATYAASTSLSSSKASTLAVALCSEHAVITQEGSINEEQVFAMHERQNAIVTNATKATKAARRRIALQRTLWTPPG